MVARMSSASSYEKHWAVFEIAARPVLESARLRLAEQGYTVEPVGPVDGGEEKAMSFVVASPVGEKKLFVDLWLLDGEERGLGSEDGSAAKVAVSLAVTDEGGGERFVHAPYNYAPGFGVSGSMELLERVNAYFDAATVASMVGAVAEKHFAQPVSGVEVAPSRSVSGVSSLSPGY